MTITSEADIVRQLRVDYEASARPVKNPADPVMVAFEFEYLYLLGVNTAEESITLRFDYNMKWIDEYLQWTPSNVSAPVLTLNLLQEDVWQPDFVLEEMLTSQKLQNVEEERRVQVRFDGQVTAYNPQVVTMLCKMKIDDFPFDSQVCFMNFGPWTYARWQVELFTVGNASDTVPNGNEEWQVISFEELPDVYTGQTGNYSGLVFKLVIKRNPVYYICVLIIPTFVISTLCLLGIFAPTTSTGERQEKINLGMNTLLTVTVILSIVAGEIPKAAQLPLLGYFLLGELLICAIATLVSIVILFIHQRAICYRVRPPKWLWNQLMFEHKSIPVHRSHTQMMRTSRQSHGGTSTLRQFNFSEFDKAMIMICNHLEEVEYEDDIRDIWTKFLDRIDVVCLIFFQISNLIVTLYIFLWHYQLLQTRIF